MAGRSLHKSNKIQERDYSPWAKCRKKKSINKQKQENNRKERIILFGLYFLRSTQPWMEPWTLYAGEWEESEHSSWTETQPPGSAYDEHSAWRGSQPAASNHDGHSALIQTLLLVLPCESPSRLVLPNHILGWVLSVRLQSNPSSSKDSCPSTSLAAKVSGFRMLFPMQTCFTSTPTKPVPSFHLVNIRTRPNWQTPDRSSHWII